MTEDLRRLRRVFARHNRRAIGLAGLSAGAALVFWALFYLIIYWLTLLALTAAGQADVQMPAAFTKAFGLGAVGLCVVAAIGQWREPNDAAVDHKSALEVFLDFLLAVPRMTLAIWGNLRALQFLPRHELEIGARFLDALAREQPIRVHQLPLHLPDARLRGRIVLALQIAGLIEARRVDDELAFVLPRKRGRELPSAMPA